MRPRPALRELRAAGAGGQSCRMGGGLCFEIRGCGSPEEAGGRWCPALSLRGH